MAKPPGVPPNIAALLAGTDRRTRLVALGACFGLPGAAEELRKIAKESSPRVEPQRREQ